MRVATSLERAVAGAIPLLGARLRRARPPLERDVPVRREPACARRARRSGAACRLRVGADAPGSACGTAAVTATAFPATPAALAADASDSSNGDADQDAYRFDDLVDRELRLDDDGHRHDDDVLR